MSSTDDKEQQLDQQKQQQLNDIKNVVDDTLKYAKQLGATAAEASMSKVQGIAVSTRLKEVENIEFTNDGGLGIVVFVGNKKGSASTADLSPEALKLTVSKAIEIAKYTSDDECAGIADKDLIATEFPDLDLYHPQALDVEQGIEQALACESAGLDYSSSIINSDGASYNANIGMKVYGNSHGINAGYPSTRYSLSCVLIGEKEDDMQRDYAYTVSRLPNMLDTPKQVGIDAAKQTISRLGAQKMSTTKAPVIFHRDIASGIFGHLIGAISGGSLYRKSSFLLDCKGQQLFPEWLSIMERPYIKQGLASSSFDNEGVQTKDLDIIENGVLQHYLLTSYSGRKLGLRSNGHAGGIHNCLVTDTGQSDSELLATMGTGLLVTEIMGQGVNIVNGDYSRGAAGFWVENGKIKYPVHEITIAGNLRDMFKNIVAIGKQKETRGALQTGSILIENMQIAGS
ncbi:metalloprotease PmbA [Glaciecola petra]|uniref:Metalloprotease PmbA n=1 Tax=Glaciecola petra TaxID=3075602 RepID=A0ABU2ZTV7_9ALTE|nr:metalloprotease PmbA [Aestuariibacter sp. P117]MDT0596084.1 metalloprotease PmbA [Aestuariibacter sp. P117]